jgi:hypothetical protein
MLLEPREVSRHVRVIVSHRFNRWDDTAASQELDEVPCASPPPLRARGDQLAALAPYRASAIVFRLAKMTPFSGISASKNDPLSLRL